MRKTFILFLFSSVFICSLKAQTVEYNKQQKNNFLDADSYYVYGDYRNAIRLFKMVEDVDPAFHEVYYKIGFSHFQLKEYKEAIPYLEKGIPYDFEALYYLTEIYLRQQKFDEADETMELYDSYWDELYAKHSVAEVKWLKNKISYAKEAMKKPIQVKIENLGETVNSKDHEYVPLIDGDESKLIFTSKRLTKRNGYNADGLPFEDVYVSYREEDGSWAKAIEIPGKINTESNDACVGLNAEGNQLFVFRPNENVFAGDIYESKLSEGEWTTPILLDDHINGYMSTEASATVSLDGKTIYFSSNRDGGFGGFDIYRVVKLPNGEWSWAKNLGPTINTNKNEDSPFLHPDGKTLYFSSEAHENMGGYDIFSSQKDENGKWKKPENLGYPINTTSDDIHFVISANEQRGYYSTEKPEGYGGQDIYMINYLERKLRQSIIRGIVLDVDGNPMSAEVSLIDLNTGDLVGVYKPRVKDGKFIFLVNPDVAYDLVVEYGNGKESVESINYTIEELMTPQKVVIQLK